MLHRLKLRLLYKEQLSSDPINGRKKLRVILISGFLVYLPFFAIAYFISFETRALYLLLIGLLAAMTCMPVAFYGYAKGLNQSCASLWQERPTEIKWLCVKIGFLYGFVLYWMILGIVEFLFGYSVMRAALISFVAAAVARDGFEIGVIRSQSEKGTITVFPDGKSIYPFLTSAGVNNLTQTFFSFGVAYGVGFLLGMVITNPIYQTLMSGLVGGGMATFVGMQNRAWNSSLISCIRFFIWPGFTMAATYFLILAYLSRILLQTRISPSADLALLIGISCAWLTIEIRFLNTLPPLYKAAIPSS